MLVQFCPERQLEFALPFFLETGHRILARNLPLDMKSSLRRLAVSSAASFLSPGSFFPVNSRRPISLVLFLSRIDRPCSFSASSNASCFTACFFSSGVFEVTAVHLCRSFVRRNASENRVPFKETKNDTGLDGHEFQTWHNGGGNFHKSAFIDSTVQIEMGATVHSKSVLGANVHVGSGTVIGPGVIIGKSTKIGYNVALSNCSIGDSCIIHSGVCIGQDGFGFFVDENGAMVKKPQVLNARIGNYVEIGANTCIDRGSWRDTVIGDHSKIDNLVQIGHNVVIGENCMLCGQVGIAGSVTIGDYVTFGGRVAVRDHVSIASKVRLAANSCVTKDIKESGDYGGFPAIPVREWRRQMANHSQFYKSRSQK